MPTRSVHILSLVAVGSDGLVFCRQQGADGGLVPGYPALPKYPGASQTHARNKARRLATLSVAFNGRVGIVSGDEQIYVCSR